jgi:hypothetical protein
VTLSKMALDMESCCAECHDLFTVMLIVIMMSVIMLEPRYADCSGAAL